VSFHAQSFEKGLLPTPGLWSHGPAFPRGDLINLKFGELFLSPNYGQNFMDKLKMTHTESILGFILFGNAVESDLRHTFQKLSLGCQIFLDAIYQNGGKMYQITTKLPNDHKIYQMAKHIPNGHKNANIYH
jgi:hypothetical protein